MRQQRRHTRDLLAGEELDVVEQEVERTSRFDLEAHRMDLGGIEIAGARIAPAVFLCHRAEEHRVLLPLGRQRDVAAEMVPASGADAAFGVRVAVGQLEANRTGRLLGDLGPEGHADVARSVVRLAALTDAGTENGAPDFRWIAGARLPARVDGQAAIPTLGNGADVLRAEEGAARVGALEPVAFAPGNRGKRGVAVLEVVEQAVYCFDGIARALLDRCARACRRLGGHADATDRESAEHQGTGREQAGREQTAREREGEAARETEGAARVHALHHHMLAESETTFSSGMAVRS